MVSVKKVGTEAIPVIKNLANIIWPATYSELITPQQVDYMMELIYSNASLQKQIHNAHQFIIAYDEQNKVIAFASYSPKNNPAACHLHKIYILPDQQGKGIGKALIDFIKQDIAPLRILQLNVNRNNKALRFYQKIGFRIISEEDIDIGNGFYMNDYILELNW